MQITTDTSARYGRPSDRPPPRLSGGLPIVGHMIPFAENPFRFLSRAAAEGGEIVGFKLLQQEFALLTGPEANEAFFRAPDDQLCRREAYKVMTPILGKGVVFDATPDDMRQQLRMLMPLIQDQRIRSYPSIIAQETREAISRWGDSGEIDLLEFNKALTLFASTHCLIGEEFRRGMTHELVEIYQHLERGVNPLAYLYPYLPLPSFRRRDEARARLGEVIDGMVRARRNRPLSPPDGLQTLIDMRYEDGRSLSSHEITGILTALMLAGHHTSAGTATWIIVELARNPQYLPAVLQEIDGVHEQSGGEITYTGLRQLRQLHNVVLEVLRLHPPLIFLIRKVLRDFHYKGYRVPAGSFLSVSPAVTHRLPQVFSRPHRFDPDRYSPERAEDDLFSWIGFGGGRHKCTGSAFGILQLRTIMSVLLREYEFDLVDAPETYQDDYTRATVLPRGPLRMRYQRRKVRKQVAVPVSRDAAGIAELDPSLPVSVQIDWDLCQGHAVCMSEAPEIFKVADTGDLTLLTEHPGPESYERLARAARFCPNRAIKIEQKPRTSDEPKADAAKKEGRMRIHVNRARCEANRVCVEAAPEVFSVDDKDVLHVLQPEVDDSLRDKVLEAVRNCPRNALTIED